MYDHQTTPGKAGDDSDGDTVERATDIEFHKSQVQQFYKLTNEYDHHLSSRIVYFMTAISFIGAVYAYLYNNKIDYSLTITGTFALFILTLIVLHEIRIYMQNTRDRHMLYHHLAILADKFNDEQAKAQLNMILGTGGSGYTNMLIFIFNAVEFLAPISIIVVTLSTLINSNHASQTETSHTELLITIIIINAIMWTVYMIAGISFVRQYIRLSSVINVRAWGYAVKRNYKFPSKKRRSKTRLGIRSRLTYYFISRLLRLLFHKKSYSDGRNSIEKFTRMLKGRASKQIRMKIHNKNSDLSEVLLDLASSLLGAYHKLNYWQRKSIYNAAYDSFIHKGNASTVNSECFHRPGVAFIDATERCNYNCKDCYSKDLSGVTDIELSQLSSIYDRLAVYGCFAYVITGGEPLLNPDLLLSCASQPNKLFFIFTNGSFINEENIRIIKLCRNIIPIISLDGNKEVNDKQRCPGSYDRCVSAIELLKTEFIGFGISSTVDKDNMNDLISDDYIGLMEKYNPCFCFFTLLTTTNGSPRIATDEYHCFVKKAKELYFNRKLTLVNVPYDEGVFLSGGECVAGQMFLHVDIKGRVKSCPYIRDEGTLDILSASNSDIDDYLAKTAIRCVNNKHIYIPTSKGIQTNAHQL